jgi:Na+/H+-translocating membrane pyrophosphatase
MPSRFQPALFGGLFIGVLSSLPFVSNLNACCCLWVIAGGVLTSYLLQERMSVPMTAGDGAVAGLLAGLVGAVITSLLGAIMSAFSGMNMQAAFEQMLSQENMPPQGAEILERLRAVPPSMWLLVSFLLTVIVFPIFSMLGGLLGVAIFKKTPPPPPPGTVEVLPPL